MIPGGGGTGGLEAGDGTAGIGTKATKPTDATNEEVVNADPGNDGESIVTTRQPDGRTEETARNKREIAIKFLKAEEEALAAEPLPLSRRSQVLRYFTALRKRLEASDK